MTKPLDLKELNKLADEIIEIFCVVDDIPYPDGTGIWGKDTEIYSTDENGTARSKARKDVIREIKQRLKSALQGLMEEIRLTDLEWVVYSDGSQKRMSEKERKEIIIEFIKKWFPDVVKDD